MGTELLWDLHTHTPYSHGKGTVEENVAAGAAAGLETIGISDHGPGHIFFGIDMKKLPDMRKDVEAAGKRHPEIKVLLGVEANIINPSGRLDISEDDFGLFDYIMAGYHYGVLGEAPEKAFRVMLGGYIYGLTGRSSARAVNYNTDIVVRAVYENPIKILTHPGDKAAFDIAEIAKACSERGTVMEINGHHNGLSIEGIRIAAEYDVMFAVQSDAHKPCNVARCEEALKRADAAGLPRGRIINLRKE